MTKNLDLLKIMNKLLIIPGPTATGKSSLGHKLANELNGEVISADSRQVYKYMDIGTGKDLENFEWGIDLVEPGEDFSASQWVKYAQKVLNDIWSRNKLPIIVGGTGLYIKELLNPSETLHIPPNYELRSMNYGLIELQEMLKKKDLTKWERMNNSDRNNPRRLVRAIEVAENVIARNEMTKQSSGRSPRFARDDTLVIGLTASQSVLFKRIDQRVEDRIKLGVKKEWEKLKKYRLPKTLGYYHDNVDDWKAQEHAYAKRQLDYMKKYLPQTVWFDISSPNVINYVHDWYKAAN
jgi:tRNA dimethylallyltransferase